MIKEHINNVNKNMIIPFFVSQQILHKNGYIEKPWTSGTEYVRPLNKKKEYPRFHIVKVDDHLDIHLDLKKKHGVFMQFVYGGKKNIIGGDDGRIREEIMRFRLDTYDEVLDTFKERIKIMRRDLICK